MKKLSTILAVVAVISLASCKKDYTCECTYTDSSGFFDNSTSTITINGKKKDVEKSCDAFDYTSGTTSNSCKIK